MVAQYELYRRSTIGMTLTDALDDLIQSQLLTPQLAVKVLIQFDQSMAEALNQKLRTRASIKGKLNVYRFCDDVWTFQVNRCMMKVDDETVNVNRLKIVACNARKSDELP